MACLYHSCKIWNEKALVPKLDSYNSPIFQIIFTSLAKEVMFLVALVSLSVCLSVCLSVDNITQKVINGLG